MSITETKLAAVQAIMAWLSAVRNVGRDSTGGPMLRGTHRDTPSDVEWDKLNAEAMLQDRVVVQVSERKWRVGKLSHIRSGDVVVPYVRLQDDTRYTWNGALEAFEKVR